MLTAPDHTRIRWVSARDRGAIVVIALVLWGGCRQTGGPVFPTLPAARTWPQAPEAARVRVVGALRGSGDLNAPLGAAETVRAALRGARPEIRFSAPHGVACRSDGLLAVADGSGAAVHIIDVAQRSHLVSRGTEEQQFGCPVGVAWVGERLFVTDAERGEVVELAATGRVVNRFAGDGMVRPVGIVYVPKRDELIIVDGGAHLLRRCDLAGRWRGTCGQRGSEPGAFNYPTHIAYDGGDRLAVADSGNFRVQLLDLTGQCLRAFGSKGDAAGDLALPKGVAFDSDGHVYVVDAQFENIQIFDDQGQLLLAVGEEGSALGQFSLPAGIAIDERNRIWVADAANRRVQVLQYLKPAEGGSAAVVASEASQ